MVEKYFAKLERVWEQNRKTTVGSTLQRLYGVPLGPELRRAKSLRGADFAKELFRLSVLTKDARFEDALFALLDHGVINIIDGKFNFLPWEGPALAKIRKETELTAFVFIYWLTSRGALLRRACAQLAALLGWPAASFAAAIKDLELIFRRRKHRGEDRCFDPDEIEFMLDFIKKFSAIEKRRCGTGRMDFSRSTSIPTTADD
jgi:hypothetical protein